MSVLNNCKLLFGCAECVSLLLFSFLRNLDSLVHTPCLETAPDGLILVPSSPSSLSHFGLNPPSTLLEISTSYLHSRLRCRILFPHFPLDTPPLHFPGQGCYTFSPLFAVLLHTLLNKLTMLRNHSILRQLGKPAYRRILFPHLPLDTPPLHFPGQGCYTFFFSFVFLLHTLLNKLTTLRNHSILRQLEIHNFWK